MTKIRTPSSSIIRDIEETDDTLDADEGEPLEFWASKQKELVTNVVDYNLSTLVDLVNTEVIDLDPRYQRRLRWDVLKQSRLIESFLMNVPVPPVFLNEDEYGKYSVIDGKQRLNAIRQFFSNSLVLQGLKVFSDINGVKFSEMPSRLRSIIRTRPTIRAIIILRQSDKDVKYEVFQRLNTGGAHLNAQEIRNNAFHGPLNDLIMNISEDKSFHAALGIKNKHNSAIYQQMRDAEFVLRYFTFKDNWRTFNGGIKREMDKFAEINRSLGESQLDTLREDFLNTLACVKDVFDSHAFHRWVPEKNDWRKQVLASLFDAQMFSMRSYKPKALFLKRAQIINGFKALCEDPDFKKSIDAATNTPSLFKKRISDMQKLIRSTVEN